MTTPRSLVLSGVVATLACGAGAAHAQCPPVRFVSPDGADAREFGGPLAMSPTDEGHRVAIGQDDSVWAFDLVDGRLTGGQELTSPFTVFNFLFGVDAEIEGDRMAIGAYQVRWPDRHYEIGSAAVYDRVADVWVHTGTLKPPITVRAEGAGSGVLIDGDTIIGCRGHLAPIIVYQPAPGTPNGWEPIQVIEQPDAIAPDSGFGHGIVAKDGWLFVGVYREDFPPNFAAGSVLVYRQQPDGTYALTQKIDGPDMGPYRIRWFGLSMGFDGRTLAVGAAFASPREDAQGAAYIFEHDGEVWTLQQTLTHRGAKYGDQFGGYAIQVDRDRLVVQASGDRTDRSDRIAYAFERTAAGEWRQSARLLPTPPYHAAQYASNLALNGDLVLVGSSDECEGPGAPATGAAYLFDLSCYECPDLDADDVLTVFDYLEFLRAFEAGEAIADMDNDGDLTVADFLAFQDAFAVGCP